MPRKTVAADHESCRLVAELVYRWTGIVIPAHHFPLLELELRKLGCDGTAAAGAARIVREEKPAIDALLRHVTNPETYMFRHFGHFQLLKELAQKKAADGEPFVAVSAGCSTGEEAWSIAAVLSDVYQPHRSNIKVIGWDINPERVQKGIVGKYSRWSARKGFFGYDKYFVDRGAHWCVGDALRPSVQFAPFNLRASPIPDGLKVDAVFFRNVSIYWDGATTKEVLGRLTGVLKPDGILFSGPSDPVPLSSGVWQCDIVNSCPVYRRRAESPIRLVMDASVRPAIKPTPVPRRVAAPRRTIQHLLTARRPIAINTTAVAAPRRVATETHKPSTATQEPRTTSHWLTSVQAYADAGQYEKALAHINANADPNDPSAILWRGILSLSLDHYDEAVSLFQQCVFLDTEDATLRRWYATALEAVGRADDAEREYRNANAMMQ